MKRIYLDLNKWADLGRAYHGRVNGVPFRDALTVAQSAVELGLASFPLSAAHYIEVTQRRDWRSRHRLAEIMATLSRFHAIASLSEVVPAEFDRALHSRYGRPEHLLPLQPFGFGVGFAFHDATLRYTPPDVLPEHVTRYELEAHLRIPFEREMLRGPKENTPLPWLDTSGHRIVHDRYRRGQDAFGERLREHGYGRGDRLRRAALAKIFVDLLDSFNEALARARVPVGELESANELTIVLQDTPSEWAVFELERARHAVGTPWESGDLIDITALSVAIAYCDVVVTERQWVHIIKQAELDKMNDTIVLDDVSKLADVLVSSSVEHAA